MPSARTPPARASESANSLIQRGYICESTRMGASIGAFATGCLQGEINLPGRLPCHDIERCPTQAGHRTQAPGEQGRSVSRTPSRETVPPACRCALLRSRRPWMARKAAPYVDSLEQLRGISGSSRLILPGLHRDKPISNNTMQKCCPLRRLDIAIPHITIKVMQCITFHHD